MLHRTDNAHLKTGENPIAKELPNAEALEKAELRRQMYERIAQGNQLAELEILAQDKFQRR